MTWWRTLLMVSLFKAQLGDRLEPDYNMESNPMRSLSNDQHSHKTQTTAPGSPCA